MDAQGRRTALAEEINKFVKTSGRMHTEVLKTTNAQTARAVLETLQAVLGEHTAVTASAYLREEGIFMGVPVVFRGGRAMISPLELSGEEMLAYEDRTRELKRFVEEMFVNLTNGHRKVYGS